MTIAASLRSHQTTCPGISAWSLSRPATSLLGVLVAVQVVHDLRASDHWRLHVHWRRHRLSSLPLGALTPFIIEDDVARQFSIRPPCQRGQSRTLPFRPMPGQLADVGQRMGHQVQEPPGQPYGGCVQGRGQAGRRSPALANAPGRGKRRLPQTRSWQRRTPSARQGRRKGSQPVLTPTALFGVLRNAHSENGLVIVFLRKQNVAYNDIPRASARYMIQ